MESYDSLDSMMDEELADLYCRRREFANNSKTEEYFKAIEAELINRGYTPSSVASLDEWRQIIAQKKSDLELVYWLKYKKFKKTAHNEIKRRHLSKDTIKALKRRIEENEDDTMLLTVNGWGTQLYGHTNKLSDGSYVATKWIVLFFIPIIPLKSYRIFSKEGDFFSREYKLKRVELNRNQVLRTYLLILGLLFSIVLVIFID